MCYACDKMLRLRQNEVNGHPVSEEPKYIKKALMYKLL